MVAGYPAENWASSLLPSPPLLLYPKPTAPASRFALPYDQVLSLFSLVSFNVACFRFFELVLFFTWTCTLLWTLEPHLTSASSFELIIITIAYFSSLLVCVCLINFLCRISFHFHLTMYILFLPSKMSLIYTNGNWSWW